MSRRLALAAALGALVMAAAPRAEAEPLVADLGSHLIAITTGFTGASVVLFGATDGPGDVIVLVRGPERDVVVRRKRRILGIWVNTGAATFTGVPGYYAVYSSRPLDEIAPPAMQALHQIGDANLRLAPKDAAARSPDDLATFRRGLLEEQQREGLYRATVGRVTFLGDRLFRASLDFPANVPTGSYMVEVLLVRDQAVVSGQITPLVISQLGVNAEIEEFAVRRSLAYGAIAVALAAMAGWLASLPFRNA